MFTNFEMLTHSDDKIFPPRRLIEAQTLEDRDRDDADELLPTYESDKELCLIFNGPAESTTWKISLRPNERMVAFDVVIRAYDAYGDAAEGVVDLTILTVEPFYFCQMRCE